MGTRRSTVDLSPSAIDRFVAAVASLKEPDPDTGISPYDRFVAVHGAVMRIEVRFRSGRIHSTNVAHWNIGFLPWHRQYLLAFEQALQTIDPGVDLPYWDWTDPATTSSLFGPAFAGSLGPPSGPASIGDGRFAGFEIDRRLQESWGTPLRRGGGTDRSWPPSAEAIRWLENLRFTSGGTHPMWIFWRILEAGWPNVLTATHNAGHNLVGGHMAGGFSPNDPVFWLHHANIDRLWARWQQAFLAAGAAEHPSDWPDPSERSPFDNLGAPYGHRLDDLMWPWVGGSSGAFVSRSVDRAQSELLPDPASFEPVTVREVLDIATLGYDYA